MTGKNAVDVPGAALVAYEIGTHLAPGHHGRLRIKLMGERSGRRKVPLNYLAGT